jgi:hypothetical protein
MARNASGDVLKLPLHERAEAALKAAVAKVIDEHARTGLPLYIWRDGRVVEVSGEELQDLARHNQQNPEFDRQ